MEEARVERRLAAILAGDVAGYSRLMGADEEGTLRQLKGHRKELVDPKITEHRGRIVKTTGDGMLVEFVSVVDAVRCAVDIQRGMAERNANVPAESCVQFRMGINVGDIISDDNDIYGDGVNVAARLQAEAPPGGICVSQTVYDVVKNRLAIKATSLGPRELKNIKDAVTVYQVVLNAHDTTAEAPPENTEPLRRSWARPVLWVPVSIGVLILLLVVVLYRPFGPRSVSSTMAPEPVKTTDPSSSSLTGPASLQEALTLARRAFFGKNDYAGMLRWLEAHQMRDSALYSQYQKMERWRSWLLTQLKAATESDPLVLAEADKPPLRVWQLADGKLVLRGLRNSTELSFEQIPAPLMLRLNSACFKRLPLVDRRRPDLLADFDAFLEEALALKLILDRSASRASDRSDTP